jgi:uncharacterized caspase-like protein
VKRRSRRSDYALLVGVGLYKDPEAFEDLKGPPNDCVDFREWLINDAGVPSDNIEMAARSPGDQRPYPNASDVREKLAKLLNLEDPNHVRSGRRLYLFSSGHCEASGFVDSHLLMADSVAADPTAYAITALAHEVRNRGLFAEIVVFLDGCRIERGHSISLQTQTIRANGNRDPIKVRVLLGFATRWGKLAYEDEFGAKARGVFSYALLEGLRGAAKDSDGAITNTSLDFYLQTRVRKLRPAGADQVPEVHCPEPIRLL